MFPPFKKRGQLCEVMNVSVSWIEPMVSRGFVYHNKMQFPEPLPKLSE